MSFYMNDPGWQYLRESPEQQIAVRNFRDKVHTMSYIFERFQNQSIPFDAKKNCWVPDEEEGFIKAEIKATKGDMTTVTTEKGNEVSFNSGYST